MPLDRQEGGHYFDFSREVCVKCGMSRKHYEDTGKPRCRGKAASSKSEPPIPFE